MYSSKSNNVIKQNIVYVLILLMLLTNFQSLLGNTISSSPNSKSSESEMMPGGNDNNPKYPFKPGYGMSVSTLPDSTSFLNRIFPISDKGIVELPIVGKLNVSRMTKSQVETFIKKNFEAYIRFPSVDVKPMIRVSVLGGFFRPGLYYISEDNSLWDVIRMAGGTNLEYGLKDLHWERNREDVVDDLIPFLQKGVSLKSMGFRSGDQIWTKSPSELTTWEQIRTNIIPLVSVASSLFLIYFTYERTR